MGEQNAHIDSLSIFLYFTQKYFTYSTMGLLSNIVSVALSCLPSFELQDVSVLLWAVLYI
jgi:hypothetical protein